MRETIQAISIWGLGLPDKDGVYPLSEAMIRSVRNSHALAAGRLQQRLFPHFSGERIVLGADIEGVLEAMSSFLLEKRRIAVLVSGDPLFFGFATRILERFGRDRVSLHSQISCLQAAAALAGVPWDRLAPVSLHGRMSRLPLAHGLLQEQPLAVLLDPVHSPAAIAEFMEERGFGAFRLTVFGGIYCERETCVFGAHSRHEALAGDAVYWQEREPVYPCVMLAEPEQKKTEPLHRRPCWPVIGVEDEDFSPRSGLITKKIVRAAALASMGVRRDSCVWDLGAGSGALSIEASRLAASGVVFAVEKQASRVDRIFQNRKRFGAANMEVLHADIVDALDSLQTPDAVFIGGGLGKNQEAAEELIFRVWERLAPGGRLVVACVLLSSLERARTALATCGVAASVRLVQIGESKELGNDYYLAPLNPVFLVSAVKE